MAKIYYDKDADLKDLKGKKLSFTDCTNIALTEKCGIKQIMSFDCGFDGLVSRLF